jgi:hypothetical protein
VQAALHQLRRFRPESADPLDRLAAANQVLGEALERLRSTSAPQFAVPSVDVALDLGTHVDRSRVLGEVFDEAARRFERTQDARKVTLPAVFGGYPASFVGPVPPRPAAARGRAAMADARWVETRLAQVAGRPASVLARQIGVELRRRLGLLDARPYAVDVAEHRIRLAGDVPILPGMSIGGAAEQVWTIVELSDGSARASLALRRGLDSSAGGGARLEATANGRTIGFDQRTTAAVGAGVVRTWTQSLASRREAEKAMADGRLDGFEELALDALGTIVPGASWLARRIDGDGIRDAARTSRSVEVAASAGTHLEITAGPSLGPSLSAEGAVTLTEERDRDADTITDVLAVDGRVAEALAGALGVTVPASTASVAVTRDGTGGTARTLTVNVAFDAAAGLRPELRAAGPAPAVISAAPAPVGAAGSSPPPAQPAPSRRHRYDVTVEVDLTDPRNEAVAAGLSADGAAATRIDEDLRAVTRVPGLGEDVLARSRITVLEQAPLGERGVGIDGLPVEAAVVSTGWRTVHAWENIDGRLRAV